MWRYIICIVQIVGESLPISSSGQVKLLTQFFTIKRLVTEPIMHVLHMPTVCVVACFFYTRWIICLRAPKRCMQLFARVTAYVALADLCTVLFYIVSKRIGTDWFPVELGLCITAFILLSTRWLPSKATRANWSFATAILLGCLQGVALLPGISRLAATYVMARWLGWSHKHSFEISFAIEVPLLIAAASKATVLHWEELQPFFDYSMILIIVGAAFFAWVALLLVNWMGYTKRLWFFSFYLYSIGVASLIIKWLIC